jgi:GNAT superfamily N-acetyltransferase
VTAAVVRRLPGATAVAGLRELVVDHARFERSGAAIPADWAERVDPWVSDGRVVLWVAVGDGAAVGYAALTRDVATWTGQEHGHLDCLFVAEAWRRTGTGRALLTAVRDFAAAEGLTQLQWQTPAWNDPAIRFYEQAGAAHASKERFVLALTGAPAA